MEVGISHLQKAQAIAGQMDEELATLFGGALAQYTTMTRAADYVRPKAYTPAPIRRFEPPKAKWPPTVAQADEWLQEYEDHQAVHKTPVGLEELHRMWTLEYAGQFADVEEPLPLAEMFALNLSRSKWHEVMYKTCKYCEKRTAAGLSQGFYPPYALLLQSAKRAAKYAKDMHFRHLKVERLRRLGELRDQPDDDDLLDAYPRTYL